MVACFRTFRSAILAGICISIAGFGYLALGGVAGAVLFSFGLLAVVNYKLKLFTGTAGFFKKGEFLQLLLILLGNITGCLLVSFLADVSPLHIEESAQKLLAGRLATGWWQCGLLAIGCGFIMTTVVTFARKGQWIPLLFGVPMFIVCGFPHCIADAFYYLAVPFGFLAENALQVLLLYVCIVAGNFVGCNLYRVINFDEAD